MEENTSINAPAGELLHTFLLHWAEITPDSTAVLHYDGSGGFESISYRRLRRQVTEYAAALDEAGLDVGDRVILESDTSADGIAMLLACSALGLTYIPVSSETPLDRQYGIMESAEPALYLHAANRPEIELPAGVNAGRFDRDTLTISGPPRTRRARWRTPIPTDPAYIVFTSGSTGRPKGVVMSHRGALTFFRGLLARGIVGPGDRVGSTAPFQFDFSLLDIALALGSGATLVPVPRGLLRWPRRFVRFLRDAEITQLNGVPSVWRPALRHEAKSIAALDRLRGVLYSGENFPLPELRQLQDLVPDIRIVNCFGSTESIASSFSDVPNPLPAEIGKLSIGFAHEGADMLLIGDDGTPVNTPENIGEIYLRSAALFTCYWDDPEATARALVPDPLNPRSGLKVYRTGDLGSLGESGEMYFHGRADSQVKIRGNRVELGEVERRIRDFPSIANAAAVVLPVAGQEPALTVFAVLAPGSTLDAAELTAFCRASLPEYMAPQRIVAVAELPLNPNGKVDRRALAGLPV
ncbi:AMP-binding protein [Nocardia sp. NPDC051030]|uniref:AMP-binding protein n=1 Tax=Nocardia sp. NPDC051030 TaxID=3155162 RepID=UPI0034339E6E